MGTSIAALVEGDKVVNMIVVEVDDDGNLDFDPPGMDVVLLPADTDVAIGHTYSNGEFTAPEPDQLDE